ncbi:MAG TPA: acetylglutamate kinase [Dehalococcoidia bacterium]|jgi:acetylglutamate kinase|nr:acetylglutamate kinase [Dehalococcoidia bacterium]MDP6272672.1 acetylglutamate kinase [Dehalococcoidia bacterium]MDP7160450.1 acetylglutamate kinase [Dehalococcoidia bacterium]MDP7212131.1 acetylglutamate kinase [Dehalococcoidia bacterium]MDP7515303.1 acetylglutamate kinase [Dehalococcoidia bacterium]
MTSVSGSRIRRSGRGAREGDVVVVKVGGSTLGKGDSTMPDLITLRDQGLKPVVVHGGGKVISDWVRLQGIQPEFVRGLRKTDKPTLDVAVAVLCGLVNAQLVAEISAAGGKAVGLAGIDGGMLKAEVLDPGLGMVGKIVRTDVTTIVAVLETGAIPVIAPAALNIAPEQEDGSDRILNINADTSAGHLAAALGAALLVFQTDVSGVLDLTRRLIPRMTRRQAMDLIDSGIANGGMIPKIEACALAVEKVRAGYIIDGRIAGALLECVAGNEIGTRIT